MPFSSDGDVRRAGLQILLPREGQHALGQGGAAFGALHGAVDQMLRARHRRRVLAQQLQIAHHRHQQVVEVVRDAAGELTDALHFLGLQKLVLRPLARQTSLAVRAVRSSTRCSRVRVRSDRASRSNASSADKPFPLQLQRLALGDIGGDADELRDRPAWSLTRAARECRPNAARPSGQNDPILDRIVGAGLQGVVDGGAHRRRSSGCTELRKILVGEVASGLRPKWAAAGLGSLENHAVRGRGSRSPDGRRASAVCKLLAPR